MAPIMLGTLQDGATLVTTPGFDPEGFLKAIMKHKVSEPIGDVHESFVLRNMIEYIYG